MDKMNVLIALQSNSTSTAIPNSFGSTMSVQSARNQILMGLQCDPSNGQYITANSTMRHKPQLLPMTNQIPYYLENSATRVIPFQDNNANRQCTVIDCRPTLQY